MTCYARYRLPYSDHYTELRCPGPPLVLPSLEALDGRQGFVIAPFEIGEDTPLVLIPERGAEIEQCAVPCLSQSLSLSKLPSELCPPSPCREGENAPAVEDSLASFRGNSPSLQGEGWQGAVGSPDGEGLEERPGLSSYAADFQRFSFAVRSGQFAKLVLSRSEECPLPDGLDADALFFRACHAFPRAMVMLFSTPLTGTWLVASPEILLDYQPPYLCTMALAGTMPHSEGLPTWSEKNQREQHVVEQYISGTLAPLADRIIKDGPRTVQAGNLLHLRTDFRFVPRQDVSLGQLLQSLHPTPAVCGLPKAEALDFIRHNESSARRYYTGFAGSLALNGETHLYVTLRCMEIADGKAFLHAGGGIMPDSVLADEWRETCHKMLKTLLLTPPNS